MSLLFFLNDTATTEIYTLSLHDALPIYRRDTWPGPASSSWPPRRTDGNTRRPRVAAATGRTVRASRLQPWGARSEEHTSELQSRQYLVCRLLLEKKKNQQTKPIQNTQRQ